MSAQARDTLTAPAAGMRLGGRYRLADLVRQAGGAAEWTAYDETLNRQVSVRTLPGRPVTIELIAAVLAAARLNDPRLARIYDADCDAECPYIVSERAPGQNLESLASGALPTPAAAAAIIASAAEALAGAHAAGSLHLCLLPRVLLWGSSGVKITGLRIDAALTGAAAADPAAADTQALARMLYALLTRYWPGPETTALPPAPRHQDLPYAPRQVRAGIPAVLDSLIRRVLLRAPQRPSAPPRRLPPSCARHSLPSGTPARSRYRQPARHPGRPRRRPAVPARRRGMLPPAGTRPPQRAGSSAWHPQRAADPRTRAARAPAPTRAERTWPGHEGSQRDRPPPALTADPGPRPKKTCRRSSRRRTGAGRPSATCRTSTSSSSITRPRWRKSAGCRTELAARGTGCSGIRSP